MSISYERRQSIVEALRRGTVPQNSLDAFAVGLERFEPALDEELHRVRAGGSCFKAIRGEYGCGKTFFARWMCDRARKMGFATAEVQISETETPLNKLETVYRRLIEHLSTTDAKSGALRSIVDSWFFTLEEDVLLEGNVAQNDEGQLLERTNSLVEQRLRKVSENAPMFSPALRGYRAAMAAGDAATADSLLAWIGGQPNVAASAKRFAGVKGDLDHFGALGFLQGVLAVIRDSGQAGLLLVLDEVETVQRMRGDVRDKSLNALRQFIDEIDAGRFPGLYVLITGTTSFFDGPQGVARLEPLAQRLHTDFATEPRFDNPRAIQVRLPAFDLQRLLLVGSRIRDIYEEHSKSPERIASHCDDRYIGELATRVTGKLGGKIGVAPRIFLKKLVADVLDRIDQFPDFDPRVHYELTMSDVELTPAERLAASAQSVDDIELDV
jgi:hypothetical protein